MNHQLPLNDLSPDPPPGGNGDTLPSASRYILKIRGTGRIPDHLQIRDEDFTLLAYFKVTNPKTALSRCNLLHKQEEILTIAEGLEYGKIQKLEI